VENSNKYDSVYSSKVRAGKRRTYFFDVRQTKGEDYFITLTESTKKYDGDGYERHKIFLYKEDFNRFLDKLQATIDHVKTELMPDFDYDEYTRRQQEWEEKKAAGLLDDPQPSTPSTEPTATEDSSSTSEEDMSW